MANEAIDAANTEFWNELCGTGLAKQLGIKDHSLESLRRFDGYYLDFYPYLLQRVPVLEMRGQDVLEVGLGYGTLGQQIAQAGARYTGLDIADGPVKMMNERLRMQGLPGQARQGSMLRCPFPDESFDAVVSIGCFHHTGDAQRCIDETHRVLRRGGKAYLMVYNQFSLRQWVSWPAATLRMALGGLWEGGQHVTETQRKAYDQNSKGGGAPETAFFSKRQLRVMLAGFSTVRLTLENCDDFYFRGRLVIPRKALLPSVGRALGLDIYVMAGK